MKKKSLFITLISFVTLGVSGCGMSPQPSTSNSSDISSTTSITSTTEATSQVTSTCVTSSSEITSSTQIEPTGTFYVYVNKNIKDAGTISGTGAYSPGSNVTLSTTLNNGYSFDGWYLDGAKKSSNLTYTFTMPEHEVTYLAKYKENVPDEILITVTCNTKRGNVYGGGKYTPGFSFSVNAIPNDGYVFSGWYINNVLKSTSIVAYFKLYEDTVIEGRFDLIEYSITYNLDGGVLPPGYVWKFNVETPTFTLPIPHKESDDYFDYTFDCWVDKNNNKISEVKLGSHDDIVVTARWDEQVAAVKYKVVFSNSSYSYESGTRLERTTESGIFRIRLTINAGQSIGLSDGSTYYTNYDKTSFGSFNPFVEGICSQSGNYVSFTESGEYDIEFTITSSSHSILITIG